MPRRDPALEDAIREIADLLATAWLRLHFPDPPRDIRDLSEAESPPGIDGQRRDRRDNSHALADACRTRAHPCGGASAPAGLNWKDCLTH